MAKKTRLKNLANKVFNRTIFFKLPDRHLLGGDRVALQKYGDDLRVCCPGFAWVPFRELWPPNDQFGGFGTVNS